MRGISPAAQRELCRRLLEFDPSIRYAAVLSGQQLTSLGRDGLQDASDEISDRYEELFVNPTLLTLTRRRGDLDCGGLRRIIVGYGHFHQIVVPAGSGHVSVAVELGAAVEALADRLEGLLVELQLPREDPA